MSKLEAVFVVTVFFGLINSLSVHPGLVFVFTILIAIIIAVGIKKLTPAN